MKSSKFTDAQVASVLKQAEDRNSHQANQPDGS